MAMKIVTTRSEFKLVEIDLDENDRYVKLDEDVYHALERFANDGRIPIDHLASEMVRHVIENLSVYDRTGKKIL